MPLAQRARFSQSISGFRLALRVSTGRGARDRLAPSQQIQASVRQSLLANTFGGQTHAATLGIALFPQKECGRNDHQAGRNHQDNNLHDFPLRCGGIMQ